MSLDNWTIKVNDQDYDPDVDTLKQVIILSPKEYREKKELEKELNEVREIANLDTKIIHDNDSYIKYVKSIAGI